MIAAGAGISRFFIQNTLLKIGPLQGMTVRCVGQGSSTKAIKKRGRTAHWAGRIAQPAFGGKADPDTNRAGNIESLADGCRLTVFFRFIQVSPQDLFDHRAESLFEVSTTSLILKLNSLADAANETCLTQNGEVLR
jgi:hypothetical protein